MCLEYEENSLAELIIQFSNNAFISFYWLLLIHFKTSSTLFVSSA